MSLDHISVFSGPSDALILERALQKIVGPTLRQSLSPADKSRIAARVVAESMLAVGIGVTSSTHLDDCIPVHGQFVFKHEDCQKTSQESSSSEYFTIEEDVRSIVGKDSIVLYYQYTQAPFAEYKPGQIRMIDADNARCLKYYKDAGTVAFRSDSFLSHMCIHRGCPCTAAAYPLPPGPVANWQQ